MNKKEVLWREKAESAPLSWDSATGSKHGIICFNDEKQYPLGPDPDGSAFNEIAIRMLDGRYYPKDAVAVTGKFSDEHRPFKVGDRLLQHAPLFGKLGGPTMAAATEIYVAHRTDNRCRVGYVTTQFHFAKGIWSAELDRVNEELMLTVVGTVCPNSWLYWIGLPYARFLQMRSWRRAVQEFRSLASTHRASG